MVLVDPNKIHEYLVPKLPVNVGCKKNFTSFNGSICSFPLGEAKAMANLLLTQYVDRCSIVGITTSSNKKGGTFVLGVNIIILFT